MMDEIAIPSVREFYNPVLQALHELGGQGSNEEIDSAVIEMLNLSQEQITKTYESQSHRNTSICADRIGWARSHLKIAGLLMQPRRKAWQLTEDGRRTRSVDPSNVSRILRVRNETRQREKSQDVHITPANPYEIPSSTIEDLLANSRSWREQLFEQLHRMSTRQLERFFLRIFKSEGIDTVEVVTSNGSAEIEGVMTSGGFLTFRVAFKFIRASRQIGAREVDDFRRQVQVGGSDKGLLITTNDFTQEAIREKSRRSSPKIELVGGEQLIDKLKELGLGVTVRKVVVELVIIDEEWFEGV